jgi:hypothetical protein
LGTPIEKHIVNTEISAKLVAFAAALTTNVLIVAGVDHLFRIPLKLHTALLEQRTSLLELRTAGVADFARRRQCACAPRGDDNCQCVATSRLSFLSAGRERPLLWRGTL